jgi:hypothetical protein
MLASSNRKSFDIFEEERKKEGRKEGRVVLKKERNKNTIKVRLILTLSESSPGGIHSARVRWKPAQGQTPHRTGARSPALHNGPRW